MVPLPEFLIGDQMRLKQILINLVKNSFKFTRKGCIRIIATYDEANEMLKVHIFDTGKGIRDDEIAQLFTRFGKLLRTASMNSEGIGMGLMICQNLINESQGTIAVFSEGENKGSTFTFTVKMKKSVEPHAIVEENREKEFKLPQIVG